MKTIWENIKRLHSEKGTRHLILVFTVGPPVLLFYGIGCVLHDVGEWMIEVSDQGVAE